MRRRLALAALAAATVAGLTGCGTDNFRDVKGVPSRDADHYEVYNNVDANPNLVLVCIHGVAFVTTTRGGTGSWRPVPALDPTCAKYQR